MRALPPHSVRFLFGVLVLFALIPGWANAATCTSIASGAWSSTSTWSCGAVPTSADVVVITGDPFGPTGYTVTVTAPAAAASIDIRPASVGQTNTLINSASLTVTGDIMFSTNAFSGTSKLNANLSSTTTAANLTIASNASTTSHLTIDTGSVSVGSVSFVGGVPSTAIIEFTDVSGSLDVTGDFGGGGTITNTVDGLIQFVGSALQTVVGYTFGRVVVNNPVGVDMGSGSPAINDSLTILAGDLDIGSNSLTVGGDLTVDGTLTSVGSTVTLSNPGTISGTGSLLGGTSLTANGSQTIGVGTDLVVTGGFTLAGGSSGTNNGQIEIDGNLTADTPGSTWTNAANSVLTLGGDLFYPTSGSFIGSAAPNTVIFDLLDESSASIDTEGASTTFHHLSFSPAGPSTTLSLQTPITVNGDLTVTAGMLDDAGNQ
ncbi:MAG TPA: hypothetical protein VIL97_02005, partial [Thermoanaerobaculia bacterium]